MWYLMLGFLLLNSQRGFVDCYRGSDNRVTNQHNEISRYNNPWSRYGTNYYYPVFHDDYNNHGARVAVGGHTQSKTRNDQDNDVSHVMDMLNTPNRRFTTGLFRTSQRGTVRIPYLGANVRVPVVAGSRKAYRGTVTTTILTREEAEARNNHRNHSNYPIHDEPAHEVCVRCPKNRTVVASRGLNYVLMEKPKLRHCHARHRVPGAKFEHLYGPKKGMPVFEGSHLVMGQVTYKQKVLQYCSYAYNVIVTKCPPLMLPRHVKADCTAGNIWGSECQLYCSQGYQLYGHNVTGCADNFKWSNSLPHCTAITGCLVPMSPMHGHLKCNTPDSGESGELLPEGSTCHYACDAGYSVPVNQQHLLTIRCNSGEWNSTADPSCQKNSLSHEHIPEGVILPQVVNHHVIHMRHRRHRRFPVHRLNPHPCIPDPCFAGGTCSKHPHSERPVCQCPPHRTGEFCEDELCGQLICKNGGFCIESQEPSCKCPNGYKGLFCEIQDLG